MKATILIDNIATSPLKDEWGLCVFIEHEGKKILLDTCGKSCIMIWPVRRDGLNPCSRRERGPNDQKEVQPWQKQAKSTK